MRIAVALPCHGQIHKDTLLSFYALMSFSAQFREVLPGICTSSIVGNARNMAVDFAQSVKATHLLMLDSDMVFPQIMLEEYLKHDVDVIAAPYRRRGPPWGMMGELEPDQDLHAAMKDGTPVRYKWLPTGLMLVKTSVFDRLEKPYFRHPVEDGKLKGEDLTFSAALTELGIPLHGLLHLPRVGHIIEGVLWNDELPIMPTEMYDLRKLEAGRERRQ